jgi:hypothetical protein
MFLTYHIISQTQAFCQPIAYFSWGQNNVNLANFNVSFMVCSMFLNTECFTIFHIYQVQMETLHCIGLIDGIFQCFLYFIFR